MTETDLERLTDQDVIDALDDAVRNERRSTAQVLRCLIEFERRRLHQKRAYPSTFAYCTGHLGYSEEAAFKRIRAARAAAKHRDLLEQLEQGKIKLSAVVAISSQLTDANREQLIEKARELPKRELEFFVAGLAPKEVSRDCIRVESPASLAQPMPKPATVEPLSAELARVAFNADRETVADIDRACALLHARRGNLGPVFARALKALLREIDPNVRLARKRARAAARAYAQGLRRIPQAVRDIVWKRDGGQCTFRDAEGKRCCATADLQFDHIVPWSQGGRSDDPANCRLLCRLHNAAAARECFGGDFIDRAIEARRAQAA